MTTMMLIPFRGWELWAVLMGEVETSEIMLVGAFVALWIASILGWATLLVSRPDRKWRPLLILFASFCFLAISAFCFWVSF